MASAPIMLNSIPISVMAKGSHLARLASTSANDKVLILIQMHGGNDGLNTIIPVDQYAEYYNLRPNIAIPDNGPRKYIHLDSSLPIENQVGIHPDMESIKELYDRARVSIVQGISYENANGSHFRSRDVMFMGGSFDDYFDSGWMGRYLDHEFPGYPEAYPSPSMPDPLAIEFGSNISLAFHRPIGIPTAVSIPANENFFDLEQSISGLPPDSIDDTHYGDELRYILDMEEKTFQYGDRLRSVYQAGGNASVEYPTTYPFNAPPGRQTSSFYQQLKIIAQLLAGGCKTKIFLTKIGGFDTHADQVTQFDSTMGNHAALLYFISTAVQAFQKDLQARGLEEQVLTMTLTEFGRRAASNGSFGTDHGNAAPMLIFGKNVNPGVIGSAPDLTNLNYGNLTMQYDYRQVYASVVKDWFEADDSAIQASRFGDWIDNRLPIIGNGITATKESFIKDRFHLKNCYPNPVKDFTTISFMINRESDVLLRIIDIKGREVKRIDAVVKHAGEQSIRVDLTGLKPGTYIYEINSGTFKESKKLIKL